MPLIVDRYHELRPAVAIHLFDPLAANPFTTLTGGPLRGLVDTGSTVTAIRAGLFDALGLRRLGSVNVVGIDGLALPRPRSSLNIALIGPASPGNAEALTGVQPYMLTDVQVVRIAESTSFDLLIGMDVISRMGLRVRTDGWFELG